MDQRFQLGNEITGFGSVGQTGCQTLGETHTVYSRKEIGSEAKLGHGAQRSIQMALFRYLADIKSNANDEGQRRLLVIDAGVVFAPSGGRAVAGCADETV